MDWLVWICQRGFAGDEQWEWISQRGFAGADLPGRIRWCGSVEADWLEWICHGGFAGVDQREWSEFTGVDLPRGICWSGFTNGFAGVDPQEWIGVDLPEWICLGGVVEVNLTGAGLPVWI